MRGGQPRHDTCLDDGTVVALLDGRLSADDRAAVEGHLDTCSQCASLVGAVAEMTVLGTTNDDEGASSGGPPTIRRLGRYTIEREIGHGGMGVVYLAHDPELDRAVAVKVLLEQSTLEEEERLIAEARTLAKLRHPNVVTIHDVSTRRGAVFIAMEFVPGGTLGDWLMRPRSPREILDAFTDAGRGLAAAHAVGVVHRDFKPNNVLVDSDGRVCVTDFGLAAIDTADRAVASSRAPASLRIAGTPAFMAPEQFLGERANARADQFSFCVSLFVALFGARPFVPAPGRTLGDAVLEGTITLTDENARRAPAWVVEAILRGLSREAARRYPSMTTLLAALDGPRVALRDSGDASGPFGEAIRDALAAAGISAFGATPDEAELLLEIDASNAVDVDVRLVGAVSSRLLFTARFDARAKDVASVVANAVRTFLDLPPRSIRESDRLVSARDHLRSDGHDASVRAVALLAPAFKARRDDASITALYAIALLRRTWHDNDANALAEARALIARARDLDPRRPEVRFAEAVSEWLFGDATAAARILGDAPTIIDAIDLSARMLLEAGAVESSFGLLKQVEPTFPRARFDRSRGLALTGQPEAAFDVLGGPPLGDREAGAYWMTATRIAGWHRDVPRLEADKALLEKTASEFKAHVSIIQTVLLGELPLEPVLPLFDRYFESPLPRTRRRVLGHQLVAELAAFTFADERALESIDIAVRDGLVDLLWLDGCPLFNHLRGAKAFVAARSEVSARADSIREALSARSRAS